ncbi:hypothetical protein R3P38DRAFT_2791333 [Favolaschia claudopus]|uniref:WD40 repeat-like protein n=1 Tax=Favolaschia claudopus TaxID=2862362 RepID=A0AAW0AGE2_9AGAR
MTVKTLVLTDPDCKVLTKLGPKLGAITKLELSLDGARLAVAQGNWIFVWDIDKKKVLHSAEGPENTNLVCQQWTPDGLTLVFSSVYAQIGIETKVKWHNLIREPEENAPPPIPFDLGSVSRHGKQMALARGREILMWGRDYGQERWSYMETLLVPLDQDLEASIPCAKSITWSNSKDLIVIFRNHGTITWKLGRNAPLPIAINGAATSHAISAGAQTGLDCSKTAIVLEDIFGVRIYNYPSHTLLAHHPATTAIEHMRFACDDTVIVGAANDILWWRAVKPSTTLSGLDSLALEGTRGVPITAVTCTTTSRRWPKSSRHYIVFAQDSTLVIWWTEESKIVWSTALKAGVLLGILHFIGVLFVQHSSRVG